METLMDRVANLIPMLGSYRKTESYGIQIRHRYILRHIFDRSMVFQKVSHFQHSSLLAGIESSLYDWRVNI